MNVVKRDNGSILFYESVFRENKRSRTTDSEGKIFPFPKEMKQEWQNKEAFLYKMELVEKFLKESKRYKKYNSVNSCKICKTKITKGMFKVRNLMWEDGLFHYIKVHNHKPSDQFIDFIFGFKIPYKSTNIRVPSKVYKKSSLSFVKMSRNQIHIMDALMEHGGYKKKYQDNKNKKIYRYSEHSGLIDFNTENVDKIVVFGDRNRVDSIDSDIFLPEETGETYDFEYIFHTHPPTPYPGGRINEGLLLEIPSIGDILHFIDHYNLGKTQGSLVMTPEGLYNIRKNVLNEKQIDIDEDKLFRKFIRTSNKEQDRIIEKYGKNFRGRNNEYFFSKIAKDKSLINKVNKVCNEFDIHIDYYPRQKDPEDNWVVDTVYLPVFPIE